MNPANIHTVAMVNVTNDTGAFQFVNPLPASAGRATPLADATKYVLRLKKADGTEIGSYQAAVYPNACRDPGQDETGLIDATIPSHPDATVLELVQDGKVLATYRPGLPPVSVQNIQPAGAAASTIGAVRWSVLRRPGHHLDPGRGRAVSRGRRDSATPRARSR